VSGPLQRPALFLPQGKLLTQRSVPANSVSPNEYLFDQQINPVIRFIEIFRNFHPS
jgi:hypothetical protein